MTGDLTDQAIRGLLVDVGADPGLDTPDFDTTFEELGLDSLARTEFATRLKHLTGVDVEDHLAPSTTPSAVRAMVYAHARPSQDA
jgi:acyl carrier protein